MKDARRRWLTDANLLTRLLTRVIWQQFREDPAWRPLWVFGEPCG